MSSDTTSGAQLPSTRHLSQARPGGDSCCWVGVLAFEKHGAPSPMDPGPIPSLAWCQDRPLHPRNPLPQSGDRSQAHLYQLVPTQPVDDLDDEILGDLKVLQPDALGAVQHEEDVDGAALAL